MLMPLRGSHEVPWLPSHSGTKRCLTIHFFAGRGVGPLAMKMSSSETGSVLGRGRWHAVVANLSTSSLRMMSVWSCTNFVRGAQGAHRGG